jgi:hypothetical protein
VARFSVQLPIMSNEPRAQHPLAIAFAGILSLAVAMGIGRFAFTPLLPVMLQEGQLDLAAGGWVAAANYAGYLVGAMTASRLRWSAVRLGLVALAATALLTAAMALPVGAWAWRFSVSPRAWRARGLSSPRRCGAWARSHASSERIWRAPCIRAWASASRSRACTAWAPLRCSRARR